MDQVVKYRQLVKDTLTTAVNDHYQITAPIEVDLISDPETGHNFVVLNGWKGDQRIYGVSIHIEVKEDGKVWIHQDSTPLIIIDHLEKAGIPTSNMVVGFHHPEMRQHTEFAIG